MMKFLFLLSQMIIISSFGFCQKINKYGLSPVSDIKVYQQLVEKDKSIALVRLDTLIPNIILDIRYAGTDNIMGSPLYKTAQSFLSYPAAHALKNVQNELSKNGYGLKIYDGYRPYSVTVAFYEKFLDTVFVASPYRGSRHNRGCAVDLSLIDLKTGKELDMPTPFDEFSPKAHTNYADLPAHVIKNRDLLKALMTKNGFNVYADEWWHFDFPGWENHPILDIAFETLLKSK